MIQALDFLRDVKEKPAAHINAVPDAYHTFVEWLEA